MGWLQTFSLPATQNLSRSAHTESATFSASHLLGRPEDEVHHTVRTYVLQIDALEGVRLIVPAILYAIWRGKCLMFMICEQRKVCNWLPLWSGVRSVQSGEASLAPIVAFWMPFGPKASLSSISPELRSSTVPCAVLHSPHQPVDLRMLNTGACAAHCG